jgi:N6-adenosine-specific RNA methylase IME4
MTVLEHIKQLSEALSPDEKRSLAAYLSSMENSVNRRPRDLYGIWKNGFPQDFDIDAALREIRGGWQTEIEELAT